MSDRSDPNAIIQLQEENRVGEAWQNALPDPGWVMERKRLGNLGNSLDGLFNLGDEIIPQSRTLCLVVGRCGTELVFRLAVENDGFHERSRRQSANTCSAGIPTASPLRMRATRRASS